ncbi:MAG: hypothetical protein GIKADHBN_01538 [Phycisphaerales bacterium]|nr:hypothetical protein [Phycisphaerales bacterium]
MSSFTGVPGSPESIWTHSMSVLPKVEVPLISLTRSPGMMPARMAGESSRGETMVSHWSCMMICAPMPTYSPRSSLLNSFLSTGGTYIVYGSLSASIMPLMAACWRTLSSMGSTYRCARVACTSMMGSRKA